MTERYSLTSSSPAPKLITFCKKGTSCRWKMLSYARCVWDFTYWLGVHKSTKTTNFPFHVEHACILRIYEQKRNRRGKKNNFALFLTWNKHDIGLNGLENWREIVMSLARTGGLGWSRKDYGYAGKVGRCEFKSVLVSTHSVSQLFVWDVNVCYIVFLHISSS